MAGSEYIKRFGDGVPDCHSDAVSEIFAEESWFTFLSVLAGDIEIQDIDAARRALDQRFADTSACSTPPATSVPQPFVPVLRLIKGER